MFLNTIKNLSTVKKKLALVQCFYHKKIFLGHKNFHKTQLYTWYSQQRSYAFANRKILEAVLKLFKNVLLS